MKLLFTCAGVILLLHLTAAQIEKAIVRQWCEYNSQDDELIMKLTTQPSPDVVPGFFSAYVRGTNTVVKTPDCSVTDDDGDGVMPIEFLIDVITPQCGFFQNADGEWCVEMITQVEDGLITYKDATYTGCCSQAYAAEKFLVANDVTVDKPPATPVEPVEYTLSARIINGLGYPNPWNNADIPLSVFRHVRLLVIINIKNAHELGITSVAVKNLIISDPDKRKELIIIKDFCPHDDGRRAGWKLDPPVPFEYAVDWTIGGGVSGLDEDASDIGKTLIAAVVSANLDPAQILNQPYILFRFELEFCKGFKENNRNIPNPNWLCFDKPTCPGRRKRETSSSTQNNMATTLSMVVSTATGEFNTSTSSTSSQIPLAVIQGFENVPISRVSTEETDCFQSWIFVVVVVVLILLLVLTVLVSFCLLYKINKKKDQINEKIGYTNHGMAA